MAHQKLVLRPPFISAQQKDNTNFFFFFFFANGELSICYSPAATRINLTTKQKVINYCAITHRRRRDDDLKEEEEEEKSLFLFFVVV